MVVSAAKVLENNLDPWVLKKSIQKTIHLGQEITSYLVTLDIMLTKMLGREVY